MSWRVRLIKGKESDEGINLSIVRIVYYQGERCKGINMKLNDVLNLYIGGILNREVNILGKKPHKSEAIINQVIYYTVSVRPI